MFKVLIVDDEPYIRKGLVNIINWKQYDCEVCGEAGDGVEGLEKMETFQPDIIFVDINMPEINGLTMIRRAKDLLPESKFIILTGYREFSYLQEAIKLGAYDYILKPSKIEEISDVLKKAVMELKYVREIENERLKLQKNFEESIPILKEKLLFDIINGTQLGPEEMDTQLALYGIDFSDYVVMIVQMDEDPTNQEEAYQRQLYQFGIINTVKDIFSDVYEVEKIVLNTKEVAFVVQPLGQERDTIHKVDTYVEDMQKLIQSCFDFSVTVAISTVGENVHELNEKAKECYDGLSYTFYLGKSSIILYKDLDTFYKSEDPSEFEHHEKKLIHAIRTGNEENVRRILDAIRHDIEEKRGEPEQVKNFYWNLIYSINHMRMSIKILENDQKKQADNLTSLYQLIEKSTNIDELQELLEEVAKTIVGRINQYNKNNINVVLQNAIAYIHEHYNLPITLNELAEHTYVSTYYLSRMFSKELGKTFVDYLNEVRIEEAKDLLQDNGFKAYEVAERVGISDAHYFSKLFKKYTSLTPTEFKAQIERKN